VLGRCVFSSAVPNGARCVTDPVADANGFFRLSLDSLGKPSLGLLLCRGKNKLVVEYAISGLDKSIAVADWKKQITETLPAEFQGSLPTIAEIEAELGRKLKAPAKEEQP